LELVERFRRCGCVRPEDIEREGSIELWFLRTCEGCELWFFSSLRVGFVNSMVWARSSNACFRSESTTTVVAQQRRRLLPAHARTVPGHRRFVAPFYRPLGSCRASGLLCRFPINAPEKTRSCSGCSVPCQLSAPVLLPRNQSALSIPGRYLQHNHTADNIALACPRWLPAEL